MLASLRLAGNLHFAPLLGVAVDRIVDVISLRTHGMRFLVAGIPRVQKSAAGDRRPLPGIHFARLRAACCQ